MVGFLIAACLQLFGGWKFCMTFCSINTFYIGVCWYIETCINDIQTFFYDIKLQLMLLKNDNDADKSNLMEFAIRRSLIKAVTLHNRILEYKSLNLSL